MAVVLCRQSESSLLASRDEMRASTLLREVQAAEERVEAGVPSGHMLSYGFSFDYLHNLQITSSDFLSY